MPRSRRASEHQRGYIPLFWRIVIANAVLLLAASLAIFVVLSPGRVSELATDEVLVVVLVLVTVVNLAIVRRIVVPLQQLTALARNVDQDRPGQRMPGASPTSEAGELALTFNEMLERLEHERAESARRVLAAHEAERLRVAQELHDEVGQTLTAVLLQLSRVNDRLSDDLKPWIGRSAGGGPHEPRGRPADRHGAETRDAQGPRPRERGRGARGHVRAADGPVGGTGHPHRRAAAVIGNGTRGVPDRTGGDDERCPPLRVRPGDPHPARR